MAIQPHQVDNAIFHEGGDHPYPTILCGSLLLKCQSILGLLVGLANKGAEMEQLVEDCWPRQLIHDHVVKSVRDLQPIVDAMEDRLATHGDDKARALLRSGVDNHVEVYAGQVGLYDHPVASTPSRMACTKDGN